MSSTRGLNAPRKNSTDHYPRAPYYAIATDDLNHWLRSPDGVQEFLSRARWDADAVRDDLRAYVVEHLAISPPCWCWTRPASQEGRQVGGRAAAVQRHGGADRELPDRRVLGLCQPPRPDPDRSALYLPERSAARTGRAAPRPAFPEEVAVRHQAEARPGDARAGPRRGRAVRWVTADSVYGADHALRRLAAGARLGYVLAVTKAQRLGLARVEDLIADVPPAGWHRLSAGDGAKGPRLYDWAYLAYGRDAARAGRRAC